MDRADGKRGRIDRRKPFKGINFRTSEDFRRQLIGDDVSRSYSRPISFRRRSHAVKPIGDLWRICDRSVTRYRPWGSGPNYDRDRATMFIERPEFVPVHLVDIDRGTLPNYEFARKRNIHRVARIFLVLDLRLRERRLLHD